MTTPAPRSILIIKTSSIGDVILTTPVAEALRQAYPQAQITWLVEEAVEDIVAGNPYVDQIVVWNRRRMRMLRHNRQWKELSEEYRRLQSPLRARRYDYCLDLQGFDRTLLAHMLIRARKRVFLPVPDRWHGYTHHIWRRKPLVHAVDYHLDVVRSAGLNIGSEVPPLRVAFSEQDAEHARSLLAPLRTRRFIVAINPLSTWASKEWDGNRYVELARRVVTELDGGVVLIGDPRNAEKCNTLAAQIGDGCLGLAGETSLKQLAALLTQCGCLITSDSGPMHLSVAVDTPVIALFGPTDPANYGPRGLSHTVIYQNLECSPCMNKHLPNPSCMSGITVDDVFSRVRSLVGNPLIALDSL